jgi:hypothetical protein
VASNAALHICTNTPPPHASKLHCTLNYSIHILASPRFSDHSLGEGSAITRAYARPSDGTHGQLPNFNSESRDTHRVALFDFHFLIFRLCSFSLASIWEQETGDDIPLTTRTGAYSVEFQVRQYYECDGEVIDEKGNQTAECI